MFDWLNLMQLINAIMVIVGLFLRIFLLFKFSNSRVKKLATIVEGDPKAPFSIATTLRCRGGRYSFPWIAPLFHGLLHFSLDMCLIILSVNQGSIKYYFLCLWYNFRIEPRSPGPLVNILNVMPVSSFPIVERNPYH